MAFSSRFPINNNPIYKNVYTQTSVNGLVPPPGSNFIITENGENIISEDGDFLITEGS